ncbi:glycosyltransferase family 117 protein [Taibaiella koreensis]|uniref:glycosyltransferase family 117 protein n=1 Tax=Taibaiella koreensis TaxID=1268548 RepID=UPI0013C2E45A|nr:DUF2723 domain-containing protein [Taibaiella koreensis]
MTYRKLNNLAGWLLALLAFILYWLTMERTASFWDCGEFLACAYKLEVGHSPGAPLFMLLQRLFALFAGPDAWLARPSTRAAYAINLLSVLSSALTIMFLFWTITRLARKIISPRSMPDRRQTLLILAAGIIGALAYTCSDTFWFSAVEAEVYATSSLFTALVFWAALRWEAIADEPYADRWLLLIAYLVGMSIGVHLLNLLTIPAIAMVWYFRRKKTSPQGVLLALLTGCLLLGIVQFGVIQYLPILASVVELFFVNSLDLPFQSGAIFFVLLLAAGLTVLLRLTQRKRCYALHTAVLGLIFIIIGFSCYIVPVIRSLANTPVDVNNPDNAVSLVPYVQREQYVHPPLLYGQDFDSPVTGVKEGKPFYYRQQDGKNHRYIPAGARNEYTFEEGSLRFFPRIWDNFEASHQAFYRRYLGLGKDESPSAKDNLSFFSGYQMNWLWWRYFMWNYAGRQNDAEGQGEPRNGNWISGIPFLDYPRTGHIDLMSDPYRYNAARNEFYCLPLLLGLAGMIWHFRRQGKDAFIILLLFFFTGIAIALYLNMSPLQPRERDYAFAGCTYAFAVWIGMGVLAIEQVLRKVLPRFSLIPAFSICLLAVPVLMLKEGWDDHNRSGKTLAQATARNTLLSCAPNAILFTQGDNDTYPLWYLQEVEGVRPDVRVVIMELLNADWYIDQLNYKLNDADAAPMVWRREDYMGDAHNYTSYYHHPQLAEDRFFDLYEVCSFIGSKQSQLRNRAGEAVSYLPSKHFSLPLPPGVQQQPAVMAEDSSRLYFSIPGEGVQKKELAVMNILAANARSGWKRPIYFNGSYPNKEDVLGLSPYLRMEGIVYRLAPFTAGDYNAAARQVDNIDVEKSLHCFTSLYRYGGAERSDTYFDEKNRVMLMSYRINSVTLAERLSTTGRKAEAIRLLDKMERNITAAAYPHDELSVYMAEAYYHAGAHTKAARLSLLLAANLRRDMAWINDLAPAQQESTAYDLQRDTALLQRLAAAAREAGDEDTARHVQGTSGEAMPAIQYKPSLH